MQREHEQLDRRGFLRLSSAGAAVAGAKALFPLFVCAEGARRVEFATSCVDKFGLQEPYLFVQLLSIFIPIFVKL
jgi:hypothetical protein